MTLRQLPTTLLLALSLPLLFGLNGCKKEGCTDPDAINYDEKAVEGGICTYPQLSLHFHPMLGTTDFSLGTVYTINGVKVRIDAFQFYVSGIEIGDDTKMLELDKYLVVKAGTMMYEIGEITAGHKHELTFDVGVDSVTNHLDPTTYAAGNPLALQSPSMHWSWNSGYIFLRVDGLVDTDGDGTPETEMNLHLGTDKFRTPIALDLHSDADVEDYTVEIEVDVLKLFTGINPATEYLTHTMDNMALANKLAANLPTLFSVE
ncbi:MAG: hypothetical protein OHK0039_12870 [Bacteroidia bacterium]